MTPGIPGEATKARPSGRAFTVYELIADGHLETVHFGRAVRVTTASIEAFVDRERSVQHPINETAIQRR
ncbi:MAG: transcriptional regulator [Microthrixaceae bacterium]|nr:transcriptional regulator [Microthrixaceae bacterium]